MDIRAGQKLAWENKVAKGFNTSDVPLEFCAVVAGSFDPVAHNRAAWDRDPVSNVFCPDLAPVWRESFRVLRPGGILMTGFMNPDVFVFDVAALDERGELIVRHPLPFSTLDLPDEERERSHGAGPIEYSHSLTEQIGGQLAAGRVTA